MTNDHTGGVVVTPPRVSYLIDELNGYRPFRRESTRRLNAPAAPWALPTNAKQKRPLPYVGNGTVTTTSS